MTGPIKLAVLLGSTREGRMSPLVARWFVERAEAYAGVKVDVLDLAELRLPEDMDGKDPAVGAARPRFADADAFVVVTPEYNHSFPAPLKTAIDSFYKEWQAKPVGFVSYGGMSGGLRAVEQLRQIFAEMHMVSVRDGVSFHNVWGHVGEDGSFPTSPDGCNQAAKTMLDQLVWWADALREAKRRNPYGS